MHHQPPQPLEALAGMVTFSWRAPLTWFEEEEPLLAHARDPHKRVAGAGVACVVTEAPLVICLRASFWPCVPQGQ